MNSLFENTETAFAIKTDTEIERASFLFKLIANQPLVRIGTAVTNFALKAQLPVVGLIRATVFDHFCGGVNEDDCMNVIDSMFEKDVHSILDYSVEGKIEENQFEFAVKKVLQVIEIVSTKEAIPFAVFKPTAFGRLHIYKKVSEGEALNDTEKLEWQRVKDRYDSVCKKAHQLNVSLLIDAEESWMQQAADDLALDMMRKYNKEKAIVFNTAQMYRWDRLKYLKELADFGDKEGFKIGIKLVRGAYMEKENKRALTNGYQSPICISKAETDKNFNNAIQLLILKLCVFRIFLGSHNEESTLKLIKLMKTHGIEKNDARIWFGQLYGMSDNITFNMAKEGYLVAKYVPYGPVRDVMPYLIRRAEENTSVAGQTNRELELITKEKKRRESLQEVNSYKYSNN